MDKAYIFASINADQYITEFHPAGCRARRPWAFGYVDLPQNDYHCWNGWQVYKTLQEALEGIRDRVNYFKDNYPNHTDLEEESDLLYTKLK